MDATKILATLDAADVELNTLMDANRQARSVDGLRSLISAAKAVETVRGHVTRAVSQTTPKTKTAKA